MLDKSPDLRRMLEEWIEIVGDRPLVPIQTSRVKMWLSKIDETEWAGAQKYAPRG